MYLDGLEQEGLVTFSSGPSDPTVVKEEVHRSGSTTITDRQHHTVFSGQPGEVAVFGIREVNLSDVR